MLGAQTPPPHSRDQKVRLKSGRKPLQPKTNSNNITKTPNQIPQIQQKEWIETPPPLIGDLNKENRAADASYCSPTTTTTTTTEICDVSLAEELSAVRKKLERLRLDRERTERVLKERELYMERQRKELVNRAELQKQFEMEVDRLYRLKELKDYCLSISPIRSLRDKEQNKKTKEAAPSSSKEVRALELELDLELELEESVDENSVQSPTPSVSSKLVVTQE